MNLTMPDLATIGLYFLLMVALAYFTRRNKTFEEFAVGKHSVPALLVFASLATTIVGPGFSIGFAGRGWTTGYLFYFLVLAYALQVILVGLFLAPRLSAYRDCRSLGDVINQKYGRFAQLLAGIVSVGLCIGFTAVMGRVGGGALHAVTGWPLAVCLVAVTGTTALITFSGGVRATIATEAAQFAIKCIVVSVLVLLLVASHPSVLADVSDRAAALSADALREMNFWQIVGVVLSFALGEALIPPYVNRALVAKTPAGSKAGFVMAGVFCVVWLGMVTFLGVAAHEILSPATSGDDVFILTGQQLLPAGMFGILLAAVIAIVMSSQESVLNSSAVAFVRDIVSVVARPTEKMTLLLAKTSTLVFAAIAIYCAQFAPNIIDGLLLLYSIWAPTILIPLVLGLYIRDTRPLAGWLSILTGGGVSLLWQSLLHEPAGIPAILVGLVACGAAYALGHALGRPVTPTAEGKPA